MALRIRSFTIEEEDDKYLDFLAGGEVATSKSIELRKILNQHRKDNPIDSFELREYEKRRKT